MGLRVEESDESFEKLLASHRRQIHAYLISLVGNPTDAEDLLQSSMVVLWEKRDQFELGTNFSAWAKRVALFHAKNHLRKIARRGDQPLMDEHLAGIVSERFDEREAEFARNRKALQSCMAKLPERQRIAIEGKFLEGHSAETTAKALGVTPNALAQIIYRAKDNLIKCMKSESQGLNKEFS